MEREIALDTETTGISPKDGHRVIEIGCVEMVNRIATGNNFHVYINPQREIDAGAIRVHGLTEDFLKDKPLFKDVADEFLEFIGDSKLVIHNAALDKGLLNPERINIKKRELRDEQVFCTLKFARKKFPGAANSLDALCRRFEINNSHRTLHGALLDSEILAEVYMELMGGKQVNIDLGNKKNQETNNNNSKADEFKLVRRDFAKRDFEVSDHE